MKKKRRILVAVLCCAFALVTAAYATNATKTIQAAYMNIKLVIDGVPVRAVGEALGKQVGWDGKTKTVYIGEVPGQVTYLLDVCQPYESYEFHTPTTFTMAGKMYSNGFILACNPYWTEGEGYALFNLNGAYSTLEFDFGHEDGTDLEDGGNYYFYLDGKLVKTITPHPEDMVKHYKISLNNALQMKIVCDLHNSARYGFANAAIQ